jgi:predicted secreted hydrolase
MHRGITRRGAIASAAALMGAVLTRHQATASLDAIDTAPAPEPVTFPRDEGVHAGFLTEWWYFTGHLEAEGGVDLGFEQVVFRASRDLITGYVSHAAMTDNAAGTFQYAQAAALPFMAEKQIVDGYHFDVRGLEMEGDHDRMRLQAAAGDYAWDLDLTPARAVVLHGGDGFVSNAAEAETYYFSRTRIDVAGTVTIAGAPVAVTGLAWFDHQWFMTAGLSGGGWDWYSLQFDDGRDLMLYYIKDETGAPEVAFCTVVEPDGSYMQVPGTRFVITPTATWVSPESGGEYPVAWTLESVEDDLSVTVRATVDNQELDTRLTTGVTYWEGAVRAEGTRAGAPVTGKGYVELTGYALGRDSMIP